MPYAKCPNCGDSFHLRVTENLDEWNAQFPQSSDGIRYIECFYCWKEFEEFDVVEVLRNSEPELEGVSLGDVGAIVLKHSENEFEVECVNSDGTTKWLNVLPRKNIKYVAARSR
ncbi:DUF4926 domain-containing protein [Cellvibrio sp. PSBB006]|uniref:DUF4926 domain-containing protein n=1 Tax=Cellvibrio sp. PSBB006 TaxID=1987723 RepID=UPI000B3B3AC6|nr:DUF4926 domain-containing protein [Cellvibrio sp. PSBB006]ARU28774.1 hypothetical protein CBR65_15745 [Cellvibrio sp. PSBB006]